MQQYRKKLIEVALPLEAINKASAREKSIRHGHPSTLHLWWARRPLAAARAVIFAQMVDDPSSWPELFPTEKKQAKERERLFKIIEDLVLWENTNNEKVLQAARDEIWDSWRRTCAENADHPRAKELFDRYKLPAFHDPFAGGGALPLEAQRLGLEAWASDLNPVAVLINKAMIEIPPKFSGMPPVNPEARKNKALFEREWKGAQGLAEDVRYYGKWMRDKAEEKIGHLYPKVEITAEMVEERPDLKPYLGKNLTVIAWIWARTVKSPNPAFSQIDVPLASTFMLSTKPGKETYVEPIIENGSYRFTIKVGKPQDAETAKNGTKLARGANFRCIMSGVVIDDPYIKEESIKGRMGTRLMAIVAEGKNERIYISPNSNHETIALNAKPEWKPDIEMNRETTNLVSGRGYGFYSWSDLFTSRQLSALTTFSDLVAEVREQISSDYHLVYAHDYLSTSRNGNNSKIKYADAVSVYFACGISRSADFWSNLCIWANQPKNELVTHLFGRQAIPMAWDYAEANPFSKSGGNFEKNLSFVIKALDFLPGKLVGYSNQADVTKNTMIKDRVISTDPPYYDNIDYADLSDYFYIWLRHSLRQVFPELFSTLTTPKTEELVAATHRHGSKEKAEIFFLEGMTKAMARLSVLSHPAFPVTIYYAFKQSENENNEGTASTGWETFLEAVIRAKFTICGTWPIRTERQGRMVGNETNALASSIILVCKKSIENSPIISRRDFIEALNIEFQEAIASLQAGNIAPVDLAQSAIGPGMAIYTRYSQVLDSEGKPVSVREALMLINQVLDEIMAEQEGDFDPDTRWAIAWFDQFGFLGGDFGVAETLSKAKNTSVKGMVEAGILESLRGKVRLLRPIELPNDWDPVRDKRLTVWEMVHHLIRILEKEGELSAADLVNKLGTKAEVARELAYRLYTICERKKRASDALAYNGLVQSFPEILRLSKEGGKPKIIQTELFDNPEE
jgi:putative DNA methylase